MKKFPFAPHERFIHIYPNIQRGTSFKLPLLFMDEDENPLDLTPFNSIQLTLKKQVFDFDYDDERALISVLAKPQTNWTDGRCYFPILSQQTWLQPGEYYFDIQLISGNKSVTRLVTMKTNIVGGPTNKTIDKESGDPEFFSDCIQFKFSQGVPIVFITNLSKQFSVSKIETLKSVPNYTWNNDAKDTILYDFGPRLSFNMNFDTVVQSLIQFKTINSPFLTELKDVCPLYNTKLKINNTNIDLIDLPNHIEFKIFQKTTQQYITGKIENGDPLAFRLLFPQDTERAKMNEIEIILIDTLNNNSTISLKLTVFCPPGITGNVLHWNLDTNWYYTQMN